VVTTAQERVAAGEIEPALLRLCAMTAKATLCEHRLNLFAEQACAPIVGACYIDEQKKADGAS
jgi:non-ribosomal peptide synthetase component E (peptide arylation enzyme)